MSIYNKLKIENISHSFDEKKIIENINIEINKGELVSIIGASGVGKSTLFNIIAGFICPAMGKIYLDNEDITNKTSKVSYMLQKDLLLPFKTVYDNVALPLIIKKEDKKKIYDKIMPLFKEFGLKGMENRYPNSLSGGQRQRVALLRTYMLNKDVILLDEPFSALDYITKNAMYEWFLNLKEKLNLTCLLITHDIDEAIFLSNKIYVMKNQPGIITNIFDISENKKNINEIFKIKQKIYDEIKEKV